jgi:chromosome segregation ATPase
VTLIDTSVLQDALDSLDQRLSTVEKDTSSDLADRVQALEDGDNDPNDFESRIDDLEREMRDKVDESDVPDFDEVTSRLDDVETKLDDLGNLDPEALREAADNITDLAERVENLEGQVSRLDDPRGDLAARIEKLEQADASDLAVRLEQAEALIADLTTRLEGQTSFFNLLRQAARLLVS